MIAFCGAVCRHPRQTKLSLGESDQLFDEAFAKFA